MFSVLAAGKRHRMREIQNYRTLMLPKPSHQQRAKTAASMRSGAAMHLKDPRSLLLRGFTLTGAGPGGPEGRDRSRQVETGRSISRKLTEECPKHFVESKIAS